MSLSLLESNVVLVDFSRRPEPLAPNFLGRACCERKGAKHPNCSLAPHDASGATGHHRRSRLTEAGRLAAMIYAAAARACEEIA
jgi:hypothetical protein